MKKFSCLSLIATVGILFSINASAATVSCIDTNNLGAGNKNASSALIVNGAANVSSSFCGPYSGNDSKDLTALTGGYGYNMSQDNGADGGWVELSKADGSNSALITGTGWGSTEGTFSFIDQGYDQYLIALKFSTVFSTYLSDSAATNWGWDTDFDNNGKYGISHLSVYGKNATTTNVSEPETLMLMSLLLGVAGIRRFKKS